VDGRTAAIESHGFRFSEDPYLYVQHVGATGPTLAPEAKSTVYLLAPVSYQHEHIDWRRDAVEFRQCVLAQLARIWITNVESRMESEKVITPDDLCHPYAVHQGTTFSLAHSLSQMLHLRTRNRFDDLQGMYLVGGGPHPGSRLPVIFESARISSRLLLEHLGVSLPQAVQASDNTLIASTAGVV
jgi:phytoene desaturase